MRHLSSAAAAIFIMTAVPGAVFSSAAAEEFAPKYEDFNSRDVNGALILELPDNVNADVEITFDSPEITAALYYQETITAGGSYSFSLEGRDNTDADYRYYALKITFTDPEYGTESVPYTEVLTVPDVNDNPDSYREYVIRVTGDSGNTGTTWEVTGEDGFTKDIAVHFAGFVLGDVDGSGGVDSSDASMILKDYSASSTGGVSDLTELQKKAADVNGDLTIDASDASKIMKYYSISSTGGTPDWDNI